MQTEKLKLEWDGRQRVSAPVKSGFYWNVFNLWWEKFGLNGNGYVVGDEYPLLGKLQVWFNERYPETRNVIGISLNNSDILWDIITPPKSLPSVNWIVCQAVLEHVKDPIRAVQHLVSLLNDDGLLYVHSHGPSFGHHRHPLDCYRWFRDGVLALGELSGASIVDILWDTNHWFLALKKERK